MFIPQTKDQWPFMEYPEAWGVKPIPASFSLKWMEASLLECSTPHRIQFSISVAD